MIIDDKEVEACNNARVDPTLDPPPTYSPPPSEPSNFTSVIRPHDSIKGTYTVDPTVPVFPGHPSTEGENLKLKSVHGSVDVELFVVGGEPEPGAGGKTVLDVRSTHGCVRIKLNAPTTSRAPFRLTAHSTHSSVAVYLPRSYEGLLTVVTGRGSAAAFSPRLGGRTTNFTEIESKVFFVGDLSRWKGSKEKWQGDEVTLSTRHGNLEVLSIEEAESRA